MNSRRHALPVLLTFVAAACRPPAASQPAHAATTASPSPQASATLIPSVTAPVATAPPVPGPRTFNESFDSGSPYWAFVQVDNAGPIAQPRIEAGFLLFDLPAPNQWAYAIYGSQEYADVRVEARVETRAGGAAGIVCRYGQTNGWYEFDIYPDQTYVILFGQWLTEGVARFTPVVRSQSEKIQATGNEIGLLCQGDILTPFVNGAQMRQREEKSFGLTGGKIGVSAASFEQVPITIAYDWVKVSEP